MSLSSPLLLGLVAGLTIVLGLPLGRLRDPAPGLRLALNATAIGVLVFLLWDVLSAAWEPLDAALGALGEGGGAAPVAGYGALFTGGLAAGLLSLVGYESWLQRRRTAPGRRFGPGAMTAGELDAPGSTAVAATTARQLALLIAVGIGLHNFAEGLAIGQSAAAGGSPWPRCSWSGSPCTTRPRASASWPRWPPRTVSRPQLAFLPRSALIGGGPTFLGAAIGRASPASR